MAIEYKLKGKKKPYASPRCLPFLGILRIKKRIVEKKERQASMFSTVTIPVLKDLLLLVHVYVRVCVGAHACPTVVPEAKELEPQVRSCGPPSTDAVNQTLVLCTSSKPPDPSSQFSSPSITT